MNWTVTVGNTPHLNTVWEQKVFGSHYSVSQTNESRSFCVTRYQSEISGFLNFTEQHVLNRFLILILIPQIRMNVHHIEVTDLKQCISYLVYSSEKLDLLFEFELVSFLVLRSPTWRTWWRFAARSFAPVALITNNNMKALCVDKPRKVSARNIYSRFS